MRARGLVALPVALALAASQLYCAAPPHVDTACEDIAAQPEGLPLIDATFAGRDGGADVTGQLGLRTVITLRRRGSEALLFITKGTLSDEVMGREFTFGARFDVTRLIEARVGERFTLVSDLRTTVGDGHECDETKPVSVEVVVSETRGRFDPAVPRLDRDFRRVFIATFAWADTGCGLKSLRGEATFTMFYEMFSKPCGVAELDAGPARPIEVLDAGADADAAR